MLINICVVTETTIASGSTTTIPPTTWCLRTCHVVMLSCKTTMVQVHRSPVLHVCAPVPSTGSLCTHTHIHIHHLYKRLTRFRSQFFCYPLKYVTFHCVLCEDTTRHKISHLIKCPSCKMLSDRCSKCTLQSLHLLPIHV